MPSATRPILALLLAALVAVAHAGAVGAQSAIVNIDPATQTVDAGTDVTFDVTVVGVGDPTGLASYEITLEFDPQILEFASFTNGAFLGSTSREVVCLPHLFDVNGDGEIDPGFVRVGCVTYGGEPPGPTGAGTLGTFTFAALCAGSSDLAFDRIGLGNPAGADIPTGTEDGAVDVEGAPCSEPGDANCSSSVDPIDAALILQLVAGLIDAVPCPEQADVNLDASTDAVDAALILQFVAGLIPGLPV